MFATHWPQSLKIVSESEIRCILDNKRKLHELWTVLGLASYIRFNEAFAIKHRNTPNISFLYVNEVGILGLILTSLSTIVNSHVCIYLICMFCLNTCIYNVYLCFNSFIRCSRSDRWRMRTLLNWTPLVEFYEVASMIPSVLSWRLEIYGDLGNVKS